MWGFQSRIVPSSPAEARSGSPVQLVVTVSARTGPVWPVSGGRVGCRCGVPESDGAVVAG